MIRATIRACEPRAAFANALHAQIVKAAPELAPEIFWSRGPIGRPAACSNFRRAVDHATASRCLWWLCLEDDQEIKPEFFTSLPALVELAGEAKVPLLYLSDRFVPRMPARKMGAFTVHPLPFPVAGAHGLLVRGDVVPRIQCLAAARAIFRQDGIIWDALAMVPGASPLQIADPVMMRHVAGESLLGHDPARSFDTLPEHR